MRNPQAEAEAKDREFRDQYLSSGIPQIIMPEIDTGGKRNVVPDPPMSLDELIAHWEVVTANRARASNDADQQAAEAQRRYNEAVVIVSALKEAKRRLANPVAETGNG